MAKIDIDSLYDAPKLYEDKVAESVSAWWKRHTEPIEQPPVVQSLRHLGIIICDKCHAHQPQERTYCKQCDNFLAEI